jgi:hypothetical protein
MLSAFRNAFFSSNTVPSVTKKGTMAHKSMLFMGSCKEEGEAGEKERHESESAAGEIEEKETTSGRLK